MSRIGRPPGGPHEGPAAHLTVEEELRLAVELSRAYYLADRSKVEIARDYGLSRFQVARLINRARDSGLVRIEIIDELPEDNLAYRLRDALDARSVTIVDGPASRVVDSIGRALAAQVVTAFHAGGIMGVTWSRSILAMADHVSGLAPGTFVQLAGHLTGDIGSPGGAEIVRRLAVASSGNAVPIYAPLIVSESSAAQTLREQAEIADAMSSFGRLQLAVVSIGAWVPSGSLVYDSVSVDVRARAADLGAVGEIAGRLFDAQGAPVDGPLGDRVIGITLDQLGTAGSVIASAYGAHRADAVLAAARISPATRLVIDRPLALALAARV